MNAEKDNMANESLENNISFSEKVELIEKAIEASHFSYAPYSHYHVGAAILTLNAEIYQGCNIENASFGATNCAERTAIFKAISDGEKEFKALAIHAVNAKNEKNYAYPCGICRQVLAEFCNPDFLIIIAKDKSDYKEYRLSELLPKSFSKDNL